jgi:alkylhydroperoxidase/carboxymuconolactone decarboxylase family protein YurZ
MNRPLAPHTSMELSDKQRRLTRLFTAAVLGEWDEVRELRRGAPAGEPDREWREAVLQVHVFAGFPRLVQTFGVLEDEGGVGTPEADELEGDGVSEQRGRKLFAQIYQGHAGQVRGMLEGFHADFASWISQHAYARVLGRPGLSAAQRELLACCALAALGQDRQLASHARGSLRCGASYAELVASLDSVADLISEERLGRARRIAERFREEG